MKKAITIWVLEGGTGGKITIKNAVELIHSSGFDAVELSFNRDGEIGLDTSNMELDKLYHEVSSTGVEISSLSTLMLNDVSITSSDYDEKKLALSIANKMLEAASILKIPTIQISPGKVTFKDSYKEVYYRSLEECGKLAKRAEEFGITIAIENDWQKFLLSPIEFAQFIDCIDNENFGACLDTRNTFLAGYPHHWAEALGNRIKKLHVTDIRRVRKVFTEFCDVGTGEVDWKTTMSVLKEVNYNGYATIEAFYKKDVPEADRLIGLSNNLSKVLELYECKNK